MNEASRRQFNAARPDFSTWLYANAGSGKTRVLTNRVARLLLEGVGPEHILCLTYTKAAATEMQNRLFEMLGQWVMLTDDKLRDELAKLGTSGPISDSQLSRARTLFALAIEAPGGLRIQTIHAFCGGLLRRFPVEAGVSPQFTEMSEGDTQDALNHIITKMTQGASRDLYRRFLGIYDNTSPKGFIAGILSKREAFHKNIPWNVLMDRHGLAPDLTQEGLYAQHIDVTDRSRLVTLYDMLASSSGKTDLQKAEVITATPELSHEGVLHLFHGLFCKKDGELSPERTYMPNAALRKGAFAALEPWYLDFRDRLIAYVDDCACLAQCEAQSITQEFAVQTLDIYERYKSDRGYLDFDDLILKTRDLLSRPDIRDWVLYRLDGSFNHILIDEAQDTSPAQWAVIQALTNELTAGLGADTQTEKTVFVVGDEKQSIYSFQGAVPEKFDEMRDAFKTRLDAIGRPFQDLYLEHSFRSSDAVLRIVDATFNPDPTSGIPKGSTHIAFNAGLPGRVDWWPLVETETVKYEGDWFDPIDLPSPQDPSSLLPQEIAQFIRQTIDAGSLLPERKHDGTISARPVHEGDFLILVQKRGPIFNNVIRACKDQGLVTAGADRLRVAENLAVKDILALFKTLITPEDDLALATVLRSPLGGWSEEDLFRLAHGRGKTFLWQQLRTDRAEDPVTLFLHDLMGQSDFLRPFDLLTRILVKHNKLKAFVNRLGPDCEDALGALQQLALDYEGRSIPSLSGFVSWMEATNADIKRQANPENKEIRIMTVHGAKGLEAPIVILADTKKQPEGKGLSQSFLPAPDGSPVWIRGGGARLSALEIAAKEAAKSAQLRERDRQLYVAMTRAENWLIVAGAGRASDHANYWHERTRDAIAQNGQRIQTPTGLGYRFEHGAWPTTGETPVSAPEPSAITPISDAPIPAQYTPFKTIAPSDLGGAKALPSAYGRDEAEATLFGTATHRLLEHWPSCAPADWDKLAEHLLDDIPPPLQREAMTQARAALNHPDAVAILDPQTLREVPITAPIFGPDTPPLYGIIDALLIKSGEVIAIDYKTNAEIPAKAAQCPNGILRQMGAYGAALRMIYPKHRIVMKIFWTSGPQMMDIPENLWQDALKSAQADLAHLDGDTRGS